MRVLICLALLLPMPSFADTILATSTITAVTVYPQGAQITREVRFAAPAGAHQVLITDLPSAIDEQYVRLAASDSITLGAFSLRIDRLPPRPALTSPELAAAKTVIEGLQLREQAALAAVADVNARVEAAEAQIEFLRSVQVDMGDRTADGLKNIAQMIGAEVLVARQAALLAQVDLPAAQSALTKVQEDLGQAQAAYDALPQRDADYAALSVAVTKQAAGDATFQVTHYLGDAGWGTVYDLTLDRKVPSLTMARGVVVYQNTGEDWSAVDLTLSTAQPNEGAEPSVLYAQPRRIVSQKVLDQLAKNDVFVSAEAGLSEPVMEPEVVEARTTAFPIFTGDTVVYHYPTRVDIASSVDALRLALDELTFTPKIEARAVPRKDETAFLIAKFTNTTDEILLPGLAYLLRDDTLVGTIEIDKIAPGADAEVPFGPIEGLRLKRDMPLRAEGDRGIISTTNQVEEKATLSVENLTDETWPVRLLDLVPYSEQEDLEISYSADPAPTEVDAGGERGVLAWMFDIGPGETKAVSLDHLMQWPEGFVLQ